MAAIRPSFWVDDSAWSATDIVVATEGETIDGELQILEVWKGGLQVGGKISIPELAAFAPESKRTVTPGWLDEKKEELPARVTGSRLALFLKKGEGASEKWLPATFYKEMNVAVVWSEQGKAYSFLQQMNPGPSLLMALRSSEAEIKAQTMKILETQTALAEAASIKSLSLRAEALRPFINSKPNHAIQLALAELTKCGEAALPVLRAMLNDQTLLHRHFDIVEVLGAVGGTAVGAELTCLVETETKFWEQSAPKLEQEWWHGKWPRIVPLQNRYSKIMSALYALKKMKYGGCKIAVTQLRDFWRSLPQLEGKNGRSQLSEECEAVLKALPDAP